MIFFALPLVAVVFAAWVPAPVPPCRVPKQALVLSVRPQRDAIGNDIAIYDRADGSHTCEIVLPRGAPPGLQVAPDGRIFVAVPAGKATNFSSDSGHLDVIGPDGRLLHRYDDGMEGIDAIALDRHGHLVVSTGAAVFRNGALVDSAPGLAVYDAASMKRVRTLPVERDSRGEFTVSPDGRTVVAEYNLRTGYDTAPDGRIELLDIATGERKARVPLRSGDWRFDGANVLARTGPNAGQLLSIPTGAALGTRPMPREADEHQPTVVGGVRYEQKDGPVGMTSDAFGPSLTMTATLTRRDVASGRELAPIAVEGVIFGYTPVDPDPALASVQPGPETRPPAFPSPEELRRALPANARGVQFTDIVSGKRITYLGAYARVDDPQDRTIRIVDCSTRVALIADVDRRAYRVVRMDKTTVDEPSAVENWVKLVKPPVSAAVEAAAVDRARLHSAFASTGYRTRVTLSYPAPVTRADVKQAEYEYATGAALRPSCARHTFGGEPLGLEPDALFENAQLYDALRASVSGAVHATGAVPPLPPESVLVYMETGDGTNAAPVFDARNFGRIYAGALPLFAAPEGYRAETTVPY
jgi:hypothetical protein